MRVGSIAVLTIGIWAAGLGAASAGPLGAHAPAAPFNAAAENAPMAHEALVTDLTGGPVAGSAIFHMDEQGLPYLGFDQESPASVTIGINAPGYQDQFTIYFPHGSSGLTLPAEDMVAMAAESVLMTGEADIWISAGPSLTDELGFARIDQVHDVLMENGIPGRWIRVDDGSIENIFDRPVTIDRGRDI